MLAGMLLPMLLLPLESNVDNTQKQLPIQMSLSICAPSMVDVTFLS